MSKSVKTRVLSVRHQTTYTYDKPVERSKHRLHLRPCHDMRQSLMQYKLTIDPHVTTIDYEDVFGNQATRFDIDKPYKALTITAESQVELLDTDPFSFANLPDRAKFPLVWMPWEQKMVAPYLQPIELPDTQLEEIRDYAQSFVERNNHDLMETLFAINLAFFREYKYLPASTNLKTTPYDVLVNKRGVCQDFSNLFICMARLLGIPARYVCGYIHTGNTGEQRAQSDATHAWLQLYIPNVGWKGFDPTNGVLPHTDHIRVAYGRHYNDTTPTSGTIYGTAKETMKVDVEVREIERREHTRQDTVPSVVPESLSEITVA